MSIQTAERHSDKEAADSVVLHRHLIAYTYAEQFIHGHVLEIGSGEGYGLKQLAPKSNTYTAIDKYDTPIDPSLKEKYTITFLQTNVPPLSGIADNSMDIVVTFQVIEHIKNDKEFVKEIYRVLKPGGKLVLTTPNIKKSLTRNPWHIREYTLTQMQDILSIRFSQIDIKGVFGNEKVMAYYQANKASVEKYTRFDLLNMQYWLPRGLLKIPYDILNRMNRNKLATENSKLVSDVITSDYFINQGNDDCFDFFCIATK